MTGRLNEGKPGVTVVSERPRAIVGLAALMVALVGCSSGGPSTTGASSAESSAVPACSSAAAPSAVASMAPPSASASASASPTTASSASSVPATGATSLADLLADGAKNPDKYVGKAVKLDVFFVSTGQRTFGSYDHPIHNRVVVTVSSDPSGLTNTFACESETAVPPPGLKAGDPISIEGSWSAGIAFKNGVGKSALSVYPCKVSKR